MKNFTPAKNQTMDILFRLLIHKSISERNFKYNGFRARMTDIRNMGITVSSKWVKFVSPFGHDGQYKEHYLNADEKKKAAEIYHTLNK